MSLVSSSLTLAQLGYTRLVRGKTLYVSGVLALAPILLAAVVSRKAFVAKDGWTAACEVLLRFVIPIAAAVHASGAVGEELDQKTFTYLWSRPIPRVSVILGRLLFVAPLLFALSSVSLVVSYLVTEGGVTGDDLVRALGAAFASSLACTCFALGGGGLFPRQPLLFTLGVFLTVEQFLFAISGARYLSIVAHTRTLAGLEKSLESAVELKAIVGLLILSALWLSLGLFRVSSAEYAAQKE